MSLSLVQSRALLGLEAADVTVEVHLANGLPSFTLVGLVETEVKESRERVRSAIQNAGLEFPNNKKIRCSQGLFFRDEQGRGSTSTLSNRKSKLGPTNVDNFGPPEPKAPFAPRRHRQGLKACVSNELRDRNADRFCYVNDGHHARVLLAAFNATHVGAINLT